MKLLSLTLVLLCSLCCSLGGTLHAMDAASFLNTPAAATTEQAKAELRSEQGPTTKGTDPALGAYTQASTPQAAINAVSAMPGCHMIKTGSGIGWVANGIAAYAEYPNPTATRIAKRNAYLKAFVQAKKELAASLNGISSRGVDQIREQVKTISDSQEDRTNLNEESIETLDQAVSMLLRGFVIYDVQDDVENKTIRVSIVTSPKTRAAVNRVNPAMMEADTLIQGLQALLSEIQNGVVPPVGGKFIKVGNTSEMAFVGYGSSVVRYNKNSNVALRLKTSAVQAAQMRARDALVGILKGDMVTWEGSVDEGTEMSHQEFHENVPNYDRGIKKLEQARSEFFNSFSATDNYQSVREGQVPPGTQTQQFLNADQTVAYAIAVYTPSAEMAANQAAAEMKPEAASKGGTTSTPPAERPDSKIEQGPTGQVTDVDDL